jgi:hypothetical protein
MILSSLYFSSSKESRKDTLFHEALHWLGIHHGDEFDSPYIASECCMNSSAPAYKEMACELLNSEPRLTFRDKRYVENFIKFMILEGRPSIAVEMVGKLILRSVKEKDSQMLLVAQSGAKVMNQLAVEPSYFFSHLISRLLKEDIKTDSHYSKNEDSIKVYDSFINAAESLYNEESSKSVHEKLQILHETLKNYLKTIDPKLRSENREHFKLAMSAIQPLVYSIDIDVKDLDSVFPFLEFSAIMKTLNQ